MKVLFNPKLARSRGLFEVYTNWADRLEIDLNKPMACILSTNIHYYVTPDSGNNWNGRGKSLPVTVSKAIFDVVPEKELKIEDWL